MGVHPAIQDFVSIAGNEAVAQLLQSLYNEYVRRLEFQNHLDLLNWNDLIGKPILSVESWLEDAMAKAL